MSIDPAGSQLSAQGVAFAPEIAGAARRHGLDPDLLAAVAAQETGGPGSNAGRNVVGDGGHGRGLFQIDDRWHAFAGTAAAMDPAKNADYAAGMLSGLLKRFGGNVHKALSAYNSGSPDSTGTATHWSDGQTLGYADSVLRHYAQLKGASGPETSPETEASAEVGGLVSSLGTLASRAQCLPLSLPRLPAASQAHHFHRQATDYSQLFGDDDATSS
jgi:soluble lytic murein transglycosylase-like protein